MTKKLTEENLEQIAGAGVKEQISAAALTAVAALGVLPGFQQKVIGYDSGGYMGGYHQKDEESEVTEKIFDFLKNAEISPAQEKVLEISNNMLKNDKKVKEASGYANKIFTVVQKISSKGAKPTEAEKILNEAVKKGDLPIQSFSYEDLENAKYALPVGRKEPEFEIVTGVDALELHKTAEDESIVNLASQFNALESPSPEFSPVKDWPYDKTQGPMCSLQSVGGTKHREAAYLLGELPDAIADIINDCKIGEVPIIKKYPALYKNGYLQLAEIKNAEDLQQFMMHLVMNKDKMKFLSQWVQCEGTGKKQLHVFTAAPSFQKLKPIHWLKNSIEVDLQRKCCLLLIDAQYRALAQAAAIRSVETGKRVAMHVTMIGQGVFNNPEDTVAYALNALNEELTGYDVKVYLHGGFKGGEHPWQKLFDKIEKEIKKKKEAEYDPYLDPRFMGL